jgi:hypothetical protein
MDLSGSFRIGYKTRKRERCSYELYWKDGGGGRVSSMDWGETPIAYSIVYRYQQC